MTTATSTLEQINPTELLCDINIRRDITLDKAFAGSIAAHGVIVPIVGYQTPEGIRVKTGHRRVAAALQAGLATVPVMVVPEGEDSARIVEQLAENDHRVAITTAERIDAISQLALLGLSASMITKKTGIPTLTVKGAIAIATNEAHREIADTYTIVVALAVAQYPDHEGRILSAAHRGGEGAVKHLVAGIIAEKLYDEAHEAVAQRLESQGLTVIREYTSGTADADTLTDWPKDHATGCPGHYVQLIDFDFDEELDEGENIADLHIEEANGISFEICEGCADWAKYGHTHKWARKSEGAVAGITGEDTEAVAQAKASTERKRVIAAGRAWKAALTVRAEFTLSLTSRKTNPKNIARFILRAHLAGVAIGQGYGDDKTDWAKVDDKMAQANQLALIIASCEAGAIKDSWRQDCSRTALYLNQLAEWGYSLSTIEIAATQRGDTWIND